MIVLIIKILAVLIAVMIISMIIDNRRFVVRTYRLRSSRIKKRLKLVYIADLHEKAYGEDNEKLAEKIKDDDRPERKKRKTSRPVEITTIEDELRTLMGTKVRITGTEKSGKIELEYYSLEELNRLIDLMRSVK